MTKTKEDKKNPELETNEDMRIYLTVVAEDINMRSKTFHAHVAESKDTPKLKIS